MVDMRKAFLGDIIENIDDDAPRLVFADWLEDNGDPARAEFIRLQCRRAAEKPWPQPGHYGVRDASLTSREEELIAEHGADWEKEAPKWATKHFRRGGGERTRLAEGSRRVIPSRPGGRTRVVYRRC